jgi:hypothetical protein
MGNSPAKLSSRSKPAVFKLFPEENRSGFTCATLLQSMNTAVRRFGTSLPRGSI